MKKKIIIVSSSGGHYEELSQLKYLEKDFDLIWVTEKTKYSYKADYYLHQTGSKDLLFPIKMYFNYLKAKKIMKKHEPDIIISTGSMIALPFFKINKKITKKIFIESFARYKDLTKTGKYLYGKVDLFLVQWE